jgi:predicted transcriptional regulator
MVDKTTNNATTQLPIAVSQAEKQLMHGTIAQFKQSIKEQLEEACPNELEEALLDRYLDSPFDCAEKVTEVLRKMRDRVSEERRKVKYINRVLPLFEYHEFWSHQPMVKIYEPIG